MKQFTFSLDRVLQWRRDAERERLQALGEARRLEDEHRRALADCQDRLDRASEQFAPDPGAVLPAGALRTLSLALESLVRQAEAAAASHGQAMEVTEAEEARFNRARTERRAVERLRDNRLAQWQQEAAREEQKSADEIAQRRARGGSA